MRQRHNIYLISRIEGVHMPRYDINTGHVVVADSLKDITKMERELDVNET